MKKKILVTEQADGRFLAHMEGCTEMAMGKSAVMALGRMVVHLAATEQIPLDVGLELRPIIGTGMALFSRGNATPGRQLRNAPKIHNGSRGRFSTLGPTNKLVPGQHDPGMQERQEMPTPKPDFITGNPVAFYLIHSCLYYHHDTSVITDQEYDQACEWILANFDRISHPHKNLIDLDALRAGSGYHLGYYQYPLQVRWIADCLERDPRYLVKLAETWEGRPAPSAPRRSGPPKQMQLPF